ncbi:MAG: PAS domain-containing sensor histidine kinase [Rhodospirillaceae bacterium]|nr:PAS domain-containing sensor histidine kinase [Rhodospirillaceae bacterium]
MSAVDDIGPVAGASDRSVWMHRMYLRTAVWARRVGLSDRLSVVLAVAAVIAGVATYAAFTGSGLDGPDPTTIIVLLNVDMALLLALTALVARRLVKLWAARRAGNAGSALHVRLAALFGVVAVVPAIATTVFSVLLFTLGIQSWFSERVSTALNESSAVAQAYLAEHQQVIKADAFSIANDLNRQWPQLSVSRALLESFLSTQVAFRGLTEAVIFTADWQVIAKTGYTFSLQTGETIPMQAIAQADVGGVAVVTGENSDRVRALVKLGSFPAAYLYVGRFIDAQVLARVARTTAAADEYARLEGRRSDIELSFTAVFVLIALLLLLVSIWFGLTLANRLVRPIANLITAAEKVGQGDLAVRVPEAMASDELATLSRAFNRMTRRLQDQQRELIETNDQLDERRRFTETVLAGVSSGVIGLDPQGLITLPNRSADKLLGIDFGKAIGRPVVDLVPEFAELLAEIRRNPDRPVQRELQIVRDKNAQVYLVRLAAEHDGATVAGFVFTFDDITELQSAQRKAAWADVARRIAHEIKNPLTPIQLSAERLKRKYADRLADDSGLFAQCTDTIVRHVGDIGRMVDEFSAFARMPAPVMAPADLRRIVADAVALQRSAYPSIAITVEQPDTPVTVRCDARQIGQAVTNVLKNAVEAIEARSADAARPAGSIAVTMSHSGSRAEIRVIDNGIGLPQHERHMLTEPYVTTRAKGTGLGLAIVKKILEDHHGMLTLADAPGGGAAVTLGFDLAAAGPAAPLQAAQ